MESIDLSESGDVHGEAAVGKNDSEHCRFVLSCASRGWVFQEQDE